MLTDTSQTIYLSIISNTLLPKKSLLKWDGQGTRASSSPYPDIPSLLAQTLPFYQCFFPASTSLPYLFISQETCLSNSHLQSHSDAPFFSQTLHFQPLNLTIPSLGAPFHPFHHSTLYNTCTHAHTPNVSYSNLLSDRGSPIAPSVNQGFLWLIPVNLCRRFLSMVIP